MKLTDQMNEWKGNFGQAYLERNSSIDIDAVYMQNYGVTRTDMNLDFLKNVNNDVRILEVGSNVGLQLKALQKMGFRYLYGIEINSAAIEVSKKNTQHINIIQGDAFDIPFKDCFFDLVFTSDVLIHIAPADIGDAMREIYRVSKKYIWGHEYYADTYTEIEYRGKKNLLWKTNFADLYLSEYADLKIIKRRKDAYLDNPEMTDEMFLLSK